MTGKLITEELSAKGHGVRHEQSVRLGLFRFGPVLDAR